MRRSSLLTGLAPALLMGYGSYLWLFGQPMQDLAGIIMLATGALALVVAAVLRYLTRSRWQTWWADLLFGLVGCVAVFAGVVAYARLHG